MALNVTLHKIDRKMKLDGGVEYVPGTPIHIDPKYIQYISEEQIPMEDVHYCEVGMSNGIILTVFENFSEIAIKGVQI